MASDDGDVVFYIDENDVIRPAARASRPLQLAAPLEASDAGHLAAKACAISKSRKRERDENAKVGLMSFFVFLPSKKNSAKLAFLFTFVETFLPTN